MSDSSTSGSSDDDDGSTVRSAPSPAAKPHLDPRAVLAVASSVPNCARVHPPDGRAIPSVLPAASNASSSILSSVFSSTFGKTFSSEADDDRRGEAAPPTMWPGDAILSFVVSDAFSIERLAAEAEGRRGSASELDGGGMARIDVYCQSGTVITCRAVRVFVSVEDDRSEYDDATDVTQQTSGTVPGGMQIRRIVRRKCTLDALRTILSHPPKLPEVDISILDAPENDDMSVGSTVSKILRRRQQQRQRGKGTKFAHLSKDQRQFMQRQQNRYEKRMLQDEKARRQVGNAILLGGMGGADDVDLHQVQSLSLEDTVPSSRTCDTASTNGSHASRWPNGEAYDAQEAIQEKIEVADIGLAMLMGEAQRLEKMMMAMHEEGKTTKPANDDDGEDGGSTLQSTVHDVDSDDESSTGSRDSEARRAARILQGCEVEYSFPHIYHDVLEGALMGEDVAEDSDSYSEDSDDDSMPSRRERRRRGRSPSGMGSTRQEEMSPIVAIPTNGEGCVILRESGAFDVIGKIPDVLQKKLFRPKGPLPERIALGTMGRYYVRFTDGSFYYYGPPSLNKVLANKKQRRGKDRNRGRRSDVAIASVAFGKDLDDWFVVRSDGSWEANGDLPEGLDDLMKTRKGRGDLLWAALGVNDEWCVSARNGRVWWEGVSDEADEALADVLAEDGENELKFIDFGPDETYFLLHK